MVTITDQHPLIDAFKQSADLLVKSTSARLCKAGLAATTKILEGHPRTAVADYAKEFGANLVLVGSRGTSGLTRFLLGSVAEATVRRSPCSVEIVRRPPHPETTSSSAMKILLATDGSECSIAAVRSVAQRPWPAGSQIRVISVTPLILPFGQTIPIAPAYYPSTEVFETLQNELQMHAEEAVARAHQIFSKAGITSIQADCHPIGDAREVILEEAKSWAADLIVVGSHGYHGIDRLFLGSVSESVAMHAHCSVEIIREAESAPPKR